MQKHYPRIAFNDNESDYETLSEKYSKTITNIKIMRNLAIEIFRAINNLNPLLLREIFKTKLNPRVQPNDIILRPTILLLVEKNP